MKPPYEEEIRNCILLATKEHLSALCVAYHPYRYTNTFLAKRIFLPYGVIAPDVGSISKKSAFLSGEY